MILKKVIISKKISPNEFEVEDINGSILSIRFPRKYLMNYINISRGDSAFVIVPSGTSTQGKFAAKSDFLNHPELNEQKRKIENEAKET